MPLGLFDIPLHDKMFMGNNPREWINKKMEYKKRIEERPIGKRLIPFRIYGVMKETVGFADPKLISEEINEEEQQKLYPNGVRIAQKLLKQPSLPLEGRKHQEEVIGTLKSRKFTEYEFLARKKITKSLVKLTKRLTARMRIVLLVDHEETLVKEKMYFKERLETRKAMILEEMKKRIPDEREYTTAAIRKARAAIIDKTMDLIEEETSKVRKQKEYYLNKAYDFQINWQLKNVVDFYQKKINSYSSKWSEMFYDMKVQMNQVMISFEEEEAPFKTLEGQVKHINEIWKTNIFNTIDEFEEELEKVKKQVARLDERIASEKMRRAQALHTINTSDSIVQSIVEQYEKLVVFAYKGHPGLCNFFLSYTKLKELHEQLIQNAWERKKSSEMKSEITENEEAEEEEIVEKPLSKDSSSVELDQFKPCRDIEKINLFRANVLKIRDLIEEVKCAFLTEPFQIREKMSDRSVELRPQTDESLEASDSAYIVDKLTDAYRLLESAILKSTLQTVETKEEGIEVDDSTLHRVEGIVKCLERHRHLLAAFASV